MRRVVIGEHSPLLRAQPAMAESGPNVVDEVLYNRLRRLDRSAQHRATPVFDWRDGYARTTQWVGVVQVPGLQVEILPKLDAIAHPTRSKQNTEHTARNNLLYMLSQGGQVPVRNRDVARLETRKAPLPETLGAIFADGLREELLRGPDRQYLHREENLRAFKGKLLISAHTRANAAHRERFFCRFDELSDDTLLNRAFKAACRTLLTLTTSPATQDALRRCLLLLHGASDVEIHQSDLDRITLTRQSQRFEALLSFCRLVLAGRTPTVKGGEMQSYSLLFDMNKIFERFVAALLCRHVAPRIPEIRVFPQAHHHRRYLLENNGAGVLLLKPDILIEAPSRRLILDTKWQLLAPEKKRRGGVSDGDLYQLHAYARRYNSPSSILLYPYLSGLHNQDFDVLNHENQHSGQRISIRYIRLDRNLEDAAEREQLIAELEKIVREGLHLAPASDHVACGSAA